MANIKDIHFKVTEMLDSFSKLFRMNKVLWKLLPFQCWNDIKTQWNNFKSICWVQFNNSEIPLDKWRLNHFTKIMMSYENDTKISSHDSITLLRIHITQRETWKSSLNFSPCGNNIYNRKRSVMTCGNKDMFSLLKLHKW